MHIFANPVTFTKALGPLKLPMTYGCGLGLISIEDINVFM